MGERIKINVNSLEEVVGAMTMCGTEIKNLQIVVNSIVPPQIKKMDELISDDYAEEYLEAFNHYNEKVSKLEDEIIDNMQKLVKYVGEMLNNE